MSDWAPTGETFHDVVVVPYTDLLDRWRDGEIHRGGPMWPEWERQVGARHRRAGSPVDVRPAEPEGPIDEAGPMAWGGAIVDQFGHQVADFSARLLATAQARPDLPVAFARAGVSVTSRQKAATTIVMLWAVLFQLGMYFL